MNDKINILFIGVICSEKLTSEMINDRLGNPNLAAQKYHRLLLEGLTKNFNQFNVKVVSLPEYIVGSHRKGYNETKNGVEYYYLPYFKNKSLKHFLNSIRIFYIILLWLFENKKNKHYVMFDILHLYSSIISLVFSKILCIKSVSTITDLPDYMYVLKEKVSLVNKLTCKAKNFVLRNTDVYIALTQSIIDRINIRNKKYAIIEGLVDVDFNTNISCNFIPKMIKIIHYSGGLYEKFGVKALIDAFMKLGDTDIELHLFGNGDLVNFINECSKKDSRIVYFGYRDNATVIEYQLRSFILVNPRFTGDEYTKYSFPSKTIEYMSTGVPLLTNKLPGIPFEYFDYVLPFDEESVEGYRQTLTRILNVPKSKLNEFGVKAQSFVINNKNNIVQTSKLFSVL